MNVLIKSNVRQKTPNVLQSPESIRKSRIQLCSPVHYIFNIDTLRTALPPAKGKHDKSGKWDIRLDGFGRCPGGEVSTRPPKSTKLGQNYD